MLSEEQLETLMLDMESDHVERKTGKSSDKIRRAICAFAFANNLPHHNQPGIIFVGITDNGKCAHTVITDQLLRELADMRSDSGILPVLATQTERQWEMRQEAE